MVFGRIPQVTCPKAKSCVRSRTPVFLAESAASAYSHTSNEFTIADQRSRGDRGEPASCGWPGRKKNIRRSSIRELCPHCGSAWSDV